MNDENNEFVNTEEPIQFSEEERQMLIERIKSAEQGKGLISNEEMMQYLDAMEERVIAYKRQEAFLKLDS